MVDDLVGSIERQLLLVLHFHLHHLSVLLIVPLDLVVADLYLKRTPSIHQIDLLRLHGHSKLLLESSEPLHKLIILTCSLPLFFFLAFRTGAISSLKVVHSLDIVVAGYHPPPWPELRENPDQLLHLAVTQLFLFRDPP